MNLTEQFDEFDRTEEISLKLRRTTREILEKNFLTFFEKFQRRLKLHVISYSVLFGLCLFAIHLLSCFIDGQNADSIINDFSYFLSLMNAAGLFLIISGSEKLREFVSNLIDLTNNNQVNINEIYLNGLRRDLLGKRMIYYGIAFGTLNCLLALIFGVPYLSQNQFWLLSTFLLQAFTIGFIGGISINETVIVISLIKNVSIKDDFHLRYFYPDKCAGTLIIGNILLQFALHFIAIGVFIFIFLEAYDWTHVPDGNAYVNALYIFWKIFPFLMAGVIFFFPAKRISKVLREYKLFEQLKIKRKMDHIRQLVIQKSDGGINTQEEIEVLNSNYQKLQKIEEELEGLNNWPYNLRYRATFLSIFLPVLIGIILEISEQLISKLIFK